MIWNVEIVWVQAPTLRLLSAVGALVGAASGYAVGGDTANAQVGGVVENNSLFKPNNTVEAKARQAILEGNIGELELVIETGGLIGEDLIIAQRLLTAMRSIGAEDAKFLASRYGVSWWNNAHHAFKGHSGVIGNQLLQTFGSKEKVFLAVQKALDTKKFTVSGSQVTMVTLNGIQTQVRIYVKDGVATISTILKMK